MNTSSYRAGKCNRVNCEMLKLTQELQNGHLLITSLTNEILENAIRFSVERPFNIESAQLYSLNSAFKVRHNDFKISGLNQGCLNTTFAAVCKLFRAIFLMRRMSSLREGVVTSVFPLGHSINTFTRVCPEPRISSMLR